MMVTKVRGQFTEYEGSSTWTAPTTTGSTPPLSHAGRQRRHRPGPARRAPAYRDFFAAETYPEITFRTTAVEEVDGRHLRLTGDLTIKDVTRPVELDLEFTGTANDPLRHHPRRLRGQHHRRPHRLGPDLQRRAGDRRRADQRQDHPSSSKIWVIKSAPDTGREISQAK